jgi:hypothetical protein
MSRDKDNRMGTTDKGISYELKRNIVEGSAAQSE